MVAATLAVAATVVIAVLGRPGRASAGPASTSLAAEMHGDPMHQQAMAARASEDAHVIKTGPAPRAFGRAEIVMLPDGTAYFMDHDLPAVGRGLHLSAVGIGR